MNLKLKIGAYAALTLVAAWFGFRFMSAYNAAHVPPPPPPQAATNAPAGAENEPATQGQTVAAPHQGATMAYLAAMVASLAGLGAMIAFDVTRFVGDRAVDFIFDDKGEGERDPEYEKAEQAWADGRHLEAIQMMRDYFKENTRAVHVPLRIAEIYEKDLKNPLAAALEYEEVLKLKLPPDRWGWAAVHLCNLYNRLGQQDKASELLQRIAKDYPRTGAAKKARQRLGIPEPEAPAETPATDAEAEAGEAESVSAIESQETYEVTAEEGAWPVETEAEPTPPPPPDAGGSPSNLPPGFRKKK